MPYQSWRHACRESGRGETLSGPSCDRCGGAGEPDGWRYGMHEDMGRYQTLYGLKPTGSHRTTADELLRDITVSCETCQGRGVRDHPPGWWRCESCAGLGVHFTVPTDVVDSLRAQILDAFPDAAAPRIPNFPLGGMIHDLQENVILGGASEMHPAYFQARFRVGDRVEHWPYGYAIISAHATGERRTQEENHRAHDELGSILQGMGVWIDVVTRYSPDTDHEEPSYAAAISPVAACDLGLRFHQDAVYYVRAGLLCLTHCDNRRALVPVGPFRERVDVVEGGRRPTQ